MDEFILLIILVFLAGLILGIFGTLLAIGRRTTSRSWDAIAVRTPSGPSVSCGAIAVGDTGHCKKYHNASHPCSALAELYARPHVRVKVFSPCRHCWKTTAEGFSNSTTKATKAE